MLLFFEFKIYKNLFLYFYFNLMKTLNLNEKKFQLEIDVFKFLSDYVERINSFVKKNQIDPDLHQDIIQRLSDQLTEKEKHWITQKIAVQIVNKLGEPEEIFGEESDFENLWNEKTKKEKSEYFYEKLQKNQRNRPQESAILLGICGMFAQVSGRNVRVWRVLFLFANRIFFMGGMGNILILGRFWYFLLALIFPRKEKDYEEKSILKYFLNQIWDLRLIVSNSIKFCFRTVKRFFCTAIPTFLKRAKKLFWPFWNFVKIGFLVLRSVFLIFILVMLGIFFYYLQTGYIWNNVEMTSIFPAITSLGVALGFISVLLFLLGSIGILFKKKLMNIASLITAIVSWILAVIIVWITGIQVLHTLHNSQEEIFTKELIIPLPENKQPLIINVAYFNPDLQIAFGELIKENKLINYIPYEWNNIKAVFSYNILAKDNTTFGRITENLSDPVFEIKDGILTIFYKNTKLFDAIVPLARMSYSVDLYIPNDWKFNITNPIYRTNLRMPERVGKRGYTWYNGQNCSDRITYDEKENVFFCPLEFNPGDWNFRQTIENDIRNNKTDELSPLEGLNTDWSFTYHNSNYWQLHSILWKTDNRFIVKLSDQMFNLFLEVEANIDEKGNISYTRLKIKEVEQKGMMTSERMKFYEGWENLKDFDIIIENNFWEKTGNYISKEEFEKQVSSLKNEINNLKMELWY